MGKMKTRLSMALLAAGVLATYAQAQFQFGTAFSYQGRLDVAGVPANGTYDFVFKLWTAPSPPLDFQAGANVTKDNVVVTDGLFQVELDFGNDPSIFNNTARWLEVLVKADGGVIYTILSPRQKITATPFSMGLRLPYSSSFNLGAGTAFEITTSGTGRVAHFEITAAASNQAAVYARTAGTGLAGHFVFDNDATAGYGVYATNNGTSGSTALYGGATGASHGISTVSTGTGRAAWFRVLNTASAANALEVSTNGTDVSQAFRASHTGLGDCGLFEITNAANAGEACEAHTNGSGDAFQGVTTGTGRAGLFLVSNDASSANALEVQTNGNGTSQAFRALHTGVGDCGLFEIANADNGGEACEARTNGSGDALQGVNSGTGRAGYFAVSNAASNATALYCTTSGGGLALNAVGRARVSELQIVGGADFSEGFDVGGDDVQPGMVVVIDSDKPGSLKPATTAYDHRVAGVISGAGGVKPGMIMGQEGSIADGKHPIALNGRVYVMADATNGAIEPGDLLTTSDHAGHVMKAVDRDRAAGATIGKAMTGLEKGQTGLVLVLVNLQ